MYGLLDTQEQHYLHLHGQLRASHSLCDSPFGIAQLVASSYRAPKGRKAASGGLSGISTRVGWTAFRCAGWLYQHGGRSTASPRAARIKSGSPARQERGNRISKAVLDEVVSKTSDTGSPNREE